MNIWLLTGEYPPDYGGGISTYCDHTVQMLCQRGHYLTVFTPAKSHLENWQTENRSDHLRVVHFGENQNPQSNALGNFARRSYDAAMVLAEFSRKEGLPDALEAQEYLGLPYFILQRSWLLDEALAKLPVLVTAHTPLYLCNLYDLAPSFRFPDYWIGEMERFSFIAADAVVYPSVCLRNEIEKELPKVRNHSLVIANPYNHPVNGGQGNKSQDRHGFLYAAKLERRKGIELLLSAFSQMWDAGMNESLYLMGDDWYDELLQRNMSELLQKKYGRYIEANLLSWKGKQSPQIVKQKLNQVRAMILPSIFENYPYAVLEAMSAGCPVIVSQSGGHSEMVENGISGYVFSHQKTGDLVDKVQSLLKLNPTEYNRMASAAQARSGQISSYDVVAPKKEAVFAKIRDRQQPRRYFPFLRGAQRLYKHPNDPAMTGKKGFLSVVIPFFNLGDYLEDTLNSFNGFHDLPYEIIVMDDGSTDEKSISELTSLHDQYGFRLERTKNQGIAATRNAGASLARGEFLAFLDADDCMDPVFYRKAVNILNKYKNVSFVGCWAEYFGEAQDYWPTWNPEPPYALVHNPLNTSALIYRRADFLRYGLNDSTFNLVMEDYDSLLSLLDNGCRGVAIPEPHFKYRIRGHSMFHKVTANVKIMAYELLCSKHLTLYQQYAQEVFGLINTNGPAYLYDNPSIWYPPLGFLHHSGSPSDITATNDLSTISGRAHLYYAVRAAFNKPYDILRGFFPAIERLRTTIKKRIVK
ncbi:MAG: glycosyltransferase [Anaerolineaceae bacterium]|nr:glycosyltransferase [Anaerolineaceae bacterium]